MAWFTILRFLSLDSVLVSSTILECVGNRKRAKRLRSRTYVHTYTRTQTNKVCLDRYRLHQPNKALSSLDRVVSRRV